MSRRGSGRRRGDTYHRRTDAEIANQRRQSVQQRQQNLQSRATFFEPRPRQKQYQGADPPPGQAQGDLARAQNNNNPGPPHAAQAPDAEVPPPEDQQGGNGRHRHLEPTDNIPLSGVNMDNIPPMFRRLVGEVMHDVRKKMIGVTKNSNQHQRFSTGAHNFPWATEEYEWRRPF
jgi:hypothetical protein